MAMLRRNEREWRLAWEALAAVSGDADFMGEDPESGEFWQYMDSTPVHDSWVHEFRHRWHPREQRRWYVRIPASTTWPPPSRRRF
ncbi:MAG: hypothetical protein ACYC8T_12160 [Myxococcaceae bacterium]